MEAPRYTNYFLPALWAGLAAPTGLYASAPQYPYYLGTYSVAQSFGQVGSYLNYALNQYSGESRRSAEQR
jgi:hypothetical protein